MINISQLSIKGKRQANNKNYSLENYSLGQLKFEVASKLNSTDYLIMYDHEKKEKIYQ